MRDTTLFGLRLTLGGYLAAHGAQKLFGAFGGRGLEASADGFDRIGLAPGRPMATLAATAELTGGLLTAAGLADPLGPITLTATMAAAAALGAPGPGRFSLDSLLGLRLPRRLARLALVGGVAAAATMIARSAVRVRRDMPAMASAAEASFPHTSGRAADSSAEGRVRPSAVTGAG